VAVISRALSALQPPEKKSKARLILEEILLLLLSVFLFAFAFPNFLYKWGWFPFAYLAIVPAFIVIHRSGWIRIFLYGFFYGFACYAVFNFWLLTWSAWGIFVVPSIYAGYFFLFFPILKLIDDLFPTHGFILQAIAWVGYEWLRTQAFLGYPYGILGYSQYLFLPLVRSASLAGIWGVTLLVIFPSAYIGSLFRNGVGSIRAEFTKRKISAVVYIALFAAVVIFGLAIKVDLSETKTWRVALAQLNIDPWRGGDPTYEKSLNVLIHLSNQAKRENPDIIVWSETAFVPSIEYHTRYRENTHRYQIVRRLKEFLGKEKITYIIGNNYREKKLLHTGEEAERSYNATVLFREGEVVDIYRKLHLVPFSEHFPYKGLLGWMRDLISGMDVHWYDKGTRYVVFEDKGVRFSTPICFEDSFGYLNRGFVRAGADVLVNMTNDSWANSVVCEIQHAAMSVFRATENRRSLVRSTNSGITCAIDPNGRVMDMIEPFTEGYLVVDVPVVRDETTLYMQWGDWLGYTALLVGLAGIAVGFIRRLIRRYRRNL
jgi:apolipoprotein N-acyltransferase